MKTLVFATNNQHKLDEVQAMIGNNFKLKSLKDIGCEADIPETGITFEENASQKSRFIFENYQVDCFSDDSGLEVDALNGEPGVYSAHYSGSRDTETNMQLVLDKLGDNSNRTARFRCVISLILDGKEHLFEGSVEGRIATEQSGTSGFGYDPIFIPEGSDRTFAQMSMEEKNDCSHRRKATDLLVAFLNKLVGYV